MHRVFGIAVTCVWLAAMAALVYRDIVPTWTAQSPPQVLTDVSWNAARKSQSRILDARDHEIGGTWSVLQPTGDHFRFESTVVFEKLPMLPPVRIETTMTLLSDGSVDEFDLAVFGIQDMFGKPLKIEMKGESYGRYIPCTLQIGPFQRSFKLDAAASRLIGDGIRPFDVLRDLKVGQSWRMQMLDPLSAILYQQARIIPVIARVERQEHREYDGEQILCFLVSAGRTQAWVAPDGRVREQQADVPGLGRLRILADNDYDEGKREKARRIGQNRSAPPATKSS